MRIHTKEDRRDRIKFRIRKRLQGTADQPRLTVFRSGMHIYVQVVDDLAGNRKGAEVVGQAIAERLKDKGIARVVFDRNGFLYHGRVRAVAEAARQAGLQF